MEQSGAPPMPKSCVNAEMMLMMGKVRPMPVSASVEASGRWPMYMRSTTLYSTLISCAAVIGTARLMMQRATLPLEKSFFVSANAPFILSIQNRPFVSPTGIRFPNAGERGTHGFLLPLSKARVLPFVCSFYCTPFGKRWQETNYSFALAAASRFWRSSS